MRQPAFQWVKLPHQARSEETLERFVKAGVKLISKKSFQSVNVRELAKAAGYSTGLFYTRFKDKGDFLRYIFEHSFGEASATAREALTVDKWTDVPLAKVLSVAIKGFVRLYERNEGLFFALYEAIQSDQLLALRVSQIEAESEDLIYELLRDHRSEYTHPDPRAAAAFLIQFGHGLVQKRALANRAVSVRPLPAHEVIIAEMHRAAVGYLGIRSS
jgi:AcrR family transcriptional regulator